MSKPSYHRATSRSHINCVECKMTKNARFAQLTLKSLEHSFYYYYLLSIGLHKATFTTFYTMVYKF